MLSLMPPPDALAPVRIRVRGVSYFKTSRSTQPYLDSIPLQVTKGICLWLVPLAAFQSDSAGVCRILPSSALS